MTQFLSKKLEEPTQIFSTRLQQLGDDTSSRGHSTNLKDRILEDVPGLQVHRQGREVILTFNDSEGQALKNLYDQDFNRILIEFMTRNSRLNSPKRN